MLVVYVPVLKGKAGEFYALAHTSPAVRRLIRPVMELVPDDQVRDLLETFCDHAMNYVPDHMVLTVDCGALSSARVLEGDAGGPVARVSESLGLRGRSMSPVFRPSDRADVLSEVAQAAAEHGHGACLRVSVPGADAETVPDEGHLHALLASVRLEPEEVDLLLDAGPVTGPSRNTLTFRVLDALKALPGRPWRSVCLASGAFPVNLTGFPRNRATPVVREDARLWRDITERWSGTPLDYGDFGVTHPRMPPRSRGRPDPNMRYTTGSYWQVFVYPKVKSGNDDFFDLSRYGASRRSP
ncbi:beta family protein [Streptomyces albidoflavus]